MADFHFIAPQWFLLVIPLVGLFIWLYKHRSSGSAWQQVIEPQLLQHLLQDQPFKQRRWPYILSFITALLAIITLANPVWEKKPQSVFQTPRALVIVLDLSASMNAADLKPSRLLRARLKVEDILRHENEGLTGLVVFAGDAFSVTPLTRDNETIRSQLRVLEPEIMPAQGSRVDLGLSKAVELLQQAGIHAGDILLIADGYDSAQAVLEAKKLHQRGHRLSILGVGTAQGAPVSNRQGDVLRDSNNVPILVKLDEEKLMQLADTGGGRYSRLSLDNTDLDYILSLPALNIDQNMDKSLIEQHQWKQNGPYLTLLLLPLAALAFRRGWLFAIMFAAILPMPQPAMAMDAGQLWDDLWQTREQRASQALQQQQHEQALSLSQDPAVKGSALYKQNRFDEALQQFQQSQGVDADYNRGNALARLGQYEEAIEAYDMALKQQPDMQDAIENKAAVEELLKQMQQQSSESRDEKNPDKDEQQEQQQQEQEQEKEQEQEQQSENQQQQQDQSSQQAEQQENDQKQDSQQQAGEGQQDDQQSQSPEQKQEQKQEHQQDQEQDNNNSQQNDNQFADATDAMDMDDDKQKQDTEKDKPREQQSTQDSQSPADENNKKTAQADQQANQLDREEQLAAEQWLRRIPDDPGGLLKRKFLYQYQQRNRKPSSRQPW